MWNMSYANKTSNSCEIALILEIEQSILSKIDTNSRIVFQICLALAQKAIP